MARARNIKPGFFKNEVFSELDPLARLLFIGLWTLADREGRLEDRPLRIKAELFPYAVSCDVESYLSSLCAAGFITRYTVAEARFLEIKNFVKHQRPHPKEAASDLPGPHQGPEQPGNYTAGSGNAGTNPPSSSFTSPSPESLYTSSGNAQGQRGLGYRHKKPSVHAGGERNYSKSADYFRGVTSDA